MESGNLSCSTSSTGISNLGSKDTQKHNSCEWHTGRSLKIVVDTQDCFQGGDRISRKNTYCDGQQIEKLRVEILCERIFGEQEGVAELESLKISVMSQCRNPCRIGKLEDIVLRIGVKERRELVHG